MQPPALDAPQLPERGSDTAALAAALMATEAAGVALSSGCAGLQGGVMGFMGIAGLVDGSMAGTEASLILGFAVFKSVLMLIALGGAALLALGATQMLRGQSRLVGLAAMVGVAVPTLQILAAGLTCSIMELLIWMIWLPLGLIAGLLAVKTPPVAHRDTW